MHFKNIWTSIVFKGVYVVLCAIALCIEFGLFQGRVYLYTLNYYTVLSNLACLIFFISAFWHSQQAARTGVREYAWRPRTEAAIVFCISITGIIYATLLAPDDMADGNFFTFKNMALHYVGPLMVVMDWLLFCPKGRLHATDPLRWLLIPLGYFVYIVIRSTFAGNIGPTQSRFPYAFIDPVVQGSWGHMLLGVLLIAVGMTALGYLIYSVDRVMSRKK